MILPDTLPSRPNLEWLRKAANQHLQHLRRTDPSARLSAAQLAIARHYGFASWRSLKAHVDRLQAGSVETTDEQAAEFLRVVGTGDVTALRAALDATPALVNCIGPHPFWGGRPQPLHVAIETGRADVAELLLTAGADVNLAIARS
jgi:ankyrin repeat protein